MYTSGEIVLLADDFNDVDGFEMGMVEQDNSEIIEDYAQL